LREWVAWAIARILAENLGGQMPAVADASTLGTMLCRILGAHALLVATKQAAVHALR
jgi:hypothetical protein